MGAPPPLDATPAERARAAADALGVDVLVAWCVALLTGRAGWGDPDHPDPAWLGGRQARAWGSPERLGDERLWWARTWAARTLLHVWDDAATSAVAHGLGDDAWRVREMCAKVVARWDVGQAGDACAACLEDTVPRVRAAAARAVGRVGESEHVEGLRALLEDADPSVREAAERALAVLSTRLDRPLA